MEYNFLLIKTNINDSLSIDNARFINNNKNIDNLINNAAKLLVNIFNSKENKLIFNNEYLKIIINQDINNDINDYNSKLYEIIDVIETAANLSEKFHSYFHFEETYLQIKIGDYHFYNKDYIYAINSYRHAIQQYHQNQIGYLKIIKCYNELINESIIKKNVENINIYTQSIQDLKKEAEKYQICLDINNVNEDLSQRPFEKFSEYLKFCECDINDFSLKKNSYWDILDRYPNHNSMQYDILTEATVDLKKRHANYHRNAAIIYYNLGQIYALIAKLVENKKIYEEENDKNLDNINNYQNNIENECKFKNNKIISLLINKIKLFFNIKINNFSCKTFKFNETIDMNKFLPKKTINIIKKENIKKDDFYDILSISKSYYMRAFNIDISLEKDIDNYNYLK
ncbi:hypothetical protein [Lyticum sinuosum]|uniref:Uncharacterized protein n=1 Tax=Lyticum sinuosum TaxID=1332059 RepID=A0AAE4VJX8_9RICK|nr:hypothetical protein [Lyticum sinuosum]MDZ5760895.1 hypothetical protein [Lyticum sinuosum]